MIQNMFLVTLYEFCQWGKLTERTLCATSRIEGLFLWVIWNYWASGGRCARAYWLLKSRAGNVVWGACSRTRSAEENFPGTRTSDSPQPALHYVNFVPRLCLLTDYTGEIPFVSSLLAAASYCKVCIRETENNGNSFEFVRKKWPPKWWIYQLAPSSQLFQKCTLADSTGLSDRYGSDPSPGGSVG